MKFLKWLDENFEKYLLLLLLSSTVVIIFLQVVMRYLFHNSLTWSEELARYLFIWLIYLGISYGVKKEIHLTIDALDSLFDEKEQIVLGIIADVAFLIFAAILSRYSLHNAVRSTRYSAALHLSMSVVYYAPVIGFVLTCIRLIQNILKKKNQLKILRGELV